MLSFENKIFIKMQKRVCHKYMVHPLYGGGDARHELILMGVSP